MRNISLKNLKIMEIKLQFKLKFINVNQIFEITISNYYLDFKRLFFLYD